MSLIPLLSPEQFPEQKQKVAPPILNPLLTKEQLNDNKAIENLYESVNKKLSLITKDEMNQNFERKLKLHNAIKGVK
jgi:hypothetical protein